MTELKSFIFITGTSILTLITPGLWGVLGAAGFYVNQVSMNPKEFDVDTFIMYCFLGFVVAMTFFNLSVSEEVGLIGQIIKSPGFLIASGYSVKRIAEIMNNILDLGIKIPKK